MRFSLETVGGPKQKTANPLSESAATLSKAMIAESLETAQVKPDRIYSKKCSIKTQKHKHTRFPKSPDRESIWG